jgi:membrane associated rhomboid family serine protease
MGIYDREYYRDDAGRWDGWASRGVTPWLVGVTVAAWFVQLVTRHAEGGGLTGWAIYNPQLILEGQVWRLLTSVFLHSEMNPLHVIFNMLVLWWTGRQLEERYGAKEFLTFYLTAGVVANLVNLAAQAAGVVPMYRGLGASGAVTAALVVYAFLYPHHRILVMFVIPMPVWGAVVLYVVLDMLGALGARVDRGEPVGYIVHLGGALFGAVYYLTDLQLTRFLPGRSGRGQSHRQPRLRVVPPDEPDDSADTDEPPPPRPPAGDLIEDRVDRLLEKVSRHGQESLTPEERELLFRAGEHYKKRRR